MLTIFFYSFQLKLDQSGKADYDLKQNQQQQQQQPPAAAVRSSPDSQNIRNASSVLQNVHAESNVAPKPSGLPQPKPAVAKRSPTDEQKQNGTNGKAVCTIRSLIVDCFQTGIN